MTRDLKNWIFLTCYNLSWADLMNGNIHNQIQFIRKQIKPQKCLPLSQAKLKIRSESTYQISYWECNNQKLPHAHAQWACYRLFSTSAHVQRVFVILFFSCESSIETLVQMKFMHFVNATYHTRNTNSVVYFRFDALREPPILETLLQIIDTI